MCQLSTEMKGHRCFKVKTDFLKNIFCLFKLSIIVLFSESSFLGQVTEDRCTECFERCSPYLNTYCSIGITLICKQLKQCM